MAYVAPDTTIYVCAGVPLDATYEHTLYFASEAAAATYFTSKAIATFSNQSYQRVRRGWLRIAANAGDLYSANYMCWKNGDAHSLSSGKWFFAFVTSVEYINEQTTEIAFELDVMQTWAANYELGHCLIDREHTVSDEIGQHTVPERLEIGDYIYDYVAGYGGGDNQSIVVAATVTKELLTLVEKPGRLYGGFYSGVTFSVFDNTPTGVDDLNDFLDLLITNNRQDAVVGIYMLPTPFINQILSNSAQNPLLSTVLMDAPSRAVGLGNYTPRNNKLFSYPFNLVYLYDGNGAGAEYKYELFEDLRPEFRLAGVLGPPAEISIVPEQYAGIPLNTNYGIKLNAFPQCCYATDTFKAWVAQNRGRLQMGTIGTAVGLGVNLLSGNWGGVISSAMQALNLNAEVKQAQTLPPQAHANAGTRAVDLASGDFGVRFCRAYIRPEYAKIIDDYFDKYGYACHLIKKPNRNVRPHWTFTKTVGCVLSKANCPADDARKICEIYDKGITFWRNASEVGNYNLDNSPAAGGQEVGGSNGTT